MHILFGCHGIANERLSAELGSIPSDYFATTDDESFNEFLKRSDILICSLPSTSKTKFLLTKERLGECSGPGRWASDQKLLLPVCCCFRARLGG